MKICMIVHAYYLKDARVRRYADLLVREGHHVNVLCLCEDNESRFEKINEVEIYRISNSRNRGGKLSYVLEYFISFILYFFKLNQLYFSGKKYDLIHIHNFPNFLVFTAIIQKIFGAKLILDIHDTVPELFRSKFGIQEQHYITKFLYFEEKLSTKFSHFIITANHAFKEILAKRCCANRDIKVVMNVPDSFFYKNENSNYLKSDNDNFKILYIGTIAERYGLETVVKAIAKIKIDHSIPGIRFVVLPKIKNEGDYLKKIQCMVNNLGLEHSFDLLDPVPHDQVPHVIKSANLAVYTPKPDVHMDIALSLKIPEIVALGCPLITSNISVLNRYFGENSMFMFDPGDVNGCVERILEVYNNPGEVNIRTKLAKQMLNKINWSKQRDEYLKIINVINTNSQNLSINDHRPSLRIKIRRLLRITISILLYYSGVSFLWRCFYSKKYVRILTYHGVESLPTNSFSIYVKEFERQIDYIRTNYNIISLMDFEKFLQNKQQIPTNSIVITFDDGFKNFYDNAYKILKRHKIPACCFVIASKLIKQGLDFMNCDQIKEIIQDGLVKIGSHSFYHRSLSELNELDLIKEILLSKLEIEKNLGISVNYFSYPYGTSQDYNKETERIISESGYLLAVTSINGVNSNRCNGFKLHRTKIIRGEDFSTFKRILAGALDIWIIFDYCLSFLQKKREVTF